MDPLWKLVWALPLVLVVGFAAMLLLRRWVGPARQADRHNPRLAAREVISLSEHTRLHLVDVDGKAYLVVESSRHTELHPVASPADAAVPTVNRLGLRWARRAQAAASR